MSLDDFVSADEFANDLDEYILDLPRTETPGVSSGTAETLLGDLDLSASLEEPSAPIPSTELELGSHMRSEIQ